MIFQQDRESALIKSSQAFNMTRSVTLGFFELEICEEARIPGLKNLDPGRTNPHNPDQFVYAFSQNQ
jgi:hypothetical protein